MAHLKTQNRILLNMNALNSFKDWIWRRVFWYKFADFLWNYGPHKSWRNPDSMALGSSSVADNPLYSVTIKETDSFNVM